MELKTALRANRTDIAIARGRLEGPGARVLEDAARDVRFVIMGEDHGIAQIAQTACALYEFLQPNGYDTLALEVGPYAARELSVIVASARPRAAMRAYLERYPFSIVFYNWREELAFLACARKLSGTRLQLLGVDQELMGASRLLLDKAAENAPNRALEERIRAFVAQEAEHYENAVETGDPSALFMMAAPLEPLQALAADLARARAGSSAPIDALLESRAIYAAVAQRDVHTAARRRAALMKGAFQAHVAKNGGKVMTKVGAYHGFRGQSPLGVLDIGSVVAELAEAGGSSSLHILVLGIDGTQLSFAGIGRPAVAESFDLRAADTSLPGARPLLDVAAEHEAWSLIDLRPVRRDLSRLDALPQEVEDMILGYDLAIIIPHASSSKELE